MECSTKPEILRDHALSKPIGWKSEEGCIHVGQRRVSKTEDGILMICGSMVEIILRSLEDTGSIRLPLLLVAGLVMMRSVVFYGHP
tara:strand:+ start:44 stop:301 length:258 start_codon:yes stop_codon:yes gene_type:complete